MISIVIPLFNKAHTIEKTLHSVLAQTFSKFEVLIINDGSTDKSIEVINSCFQDNRIRIINQGNQGVSAARNRGVNLSSFKYIAFIDGDDEWKPGFLEKIVSVIRKYPDAGIYETSSLHYNYVSKVIHDGTISAYRNKIQYVDFFKYPYINLAHTSAIVVNKTFFNKSFLNNEGFPVGVKMKEDFSCFYKIALISKVIYIGIPLAIRNNEIEGQITGDNSKNKYIDDEINFLNTTFQFYINTKIINKKFIQFRKYEIRHIIYNLIKANEWQTLNYFLSKINESMIKILENKELSYYRQPNKKSISIILILITKIPWRFKYYLYNNINISEKN